MKATVKLVFSIFTSLLLCNCATTPTVAENPSQTELGPMEKPELSVRRFYQIDKKSGKERYYEHIKVNADGSHTGRNSEGCSWEDMGDLVAPAASWSNCGSNPEWKNGESRNLTKKGEIWPLQVGNTVSYSYVQVNAYGDEKGKNTRKCEVLSQVNIEVVSGNVDAYKVRCIRRKGDWSRTRVWYFSPEIQADVKYMNITSSNGVERDYELSRIEDL